MSRRILHLCLLLILAATAAFAQKLPAVSPAATVDGVVAANEYSLSVPLDKMTLFAARTADTLYVAVQAETTGWVAFGAGSLRMDKAWIYIGYVKGAEVGFDSHRGAGHRHQAAASAPTAAYSLGEAAGVTTLELSFKLTDLIAAGQADLKCIVAIGRQDNLGSIHARRRAVTLQL
jgi:hypothetical protein